MSDLVISFTGTRKGLTTIQHEMLEDMFTCTPRGLDVTLHHGDCKGADAIAHDIAQALGWNVVVHPPLHDGYRAWCGGATATWQAKEYLQRNHDIVDCGHGLVACPDGPERQRSGTWATIRYARKLGRQIFILYPDGKHAIEEEADG